MTRSAAGSQDIVGALTAALSRVDSWINSEADDSPSLTVPAYSGAAKQSTDSTDAMAAEPESPRSVPRAAARVAVANGFTTDATTRAQSKSGSNSLTPRSESAEPAQQSETVPASRAATTRQTAALDLTEAIRSLATQQPQVERVSHQELTVAEALPRQTLPIAEPPVISIGRIEVEVVPPPQVPLAPIAARPVNGASSSFRTHTGYQAPQRAFGWRQG